MNTNNTFLKVRLITGEPMEIHMDAGDLIMAFTTMFNMQWPYQPTGVRVQKGSNGGSLMFYENVGLSYQNFFIDIDSVDPAIAFFKSWGFINCDG